MRQGNVATHAMSASREFRIGTAGWTVHDFNDCKYEQSWECEHVELIDGVIVEMPPALYGGNGASGRLLRILMQSEFFRSGYLMAELDLLIDEQTIFRPDFTWLTLEDDQQHRREAHKQGRGLAKSRLAVAPTLLVESISEGYERYDRVVKFRRYAEFGVRNYWIIDGFARRLDCFVLEEKSFRIQASGRDADILAPTLFAPLTISLSELWVD